MTEQQGSASDLSGDTLTRCDGSPVSPDAIPPVPYHNFRFDGDDPYIVCTLCGERRDAISGRVLTPGRAR